MKIFHFSDIDLQIIKPSYFGKNSYTANDKQASNVKRSFFYTVKNPLEYLFHSSSFRYTVDIPESLIYNLDIDEANIKEKFNFDIEKILKWVKARYQGAIYTTSFKTVILFYAVEVSRKEERGQSWKN
jgi:hypothetical protein